MNTELVWREAFAYADKFVETDSAIEFANYYMSHIKHDFFPYFEDIFNQWTEKIVANS